MIEVLTYNVHKGFDRRNRNFVLHGIKQHLEEAEVDIVFLQEIQGRHLRHEKRIPTWPEMSQFEFLANRVWPHFAYGKNAIYRRGHHGNAILSKYEIAEYSNINLSRFQFASRSLLHGRIHLPGSRGPLHLLCVHLDLFDFERKRQVTALKHYLDSYTGADEPVIVAGDFNDWRGKQGAVLEDRLGLKEAHRETTGRYARTFPAHRPWLCLDRIYYRGLELDESRCLERYPWADLSDHLPLYARFV